MYRQSVVRDALLVMHPIFKYQFVWRCTPGCLSCVLYAAGDTLFPRRMQMKPPRRSIQVDTLRIASRRQW
jgi:hypothetical protein